LFLELPVIENSIQELRCMIKEDFHAYWYSYIPTEVAVSVSSQHIITKNSQNLDVQNKKKILLDSLCAASVVRKQVSEGI
jgi:hypothetical protein